MRLLKSWWDCLPFPSRVGKKWGEVMADVENEQQHFTCPILITLRLQKAPAANNSVNNRNLNSVCNFFYAFALTREHFAGSLNLLFSFTFSLNLCYLHVFITGTFTQCSSLWNCTSGKLISLIAIFSVRNNQSTILNSSSNWLNSTFLIFSRLKLNHSWILKIWH